MVMAFGQVLDVADEQGMLVRDALSGEQARPVLTAREVLRKEAPAVGPSPRSTLYRRLGCSLHSFHSLLSSSRSGVARKDRGVAHSSSTFGLSLRHAQHGHPFPTRADPVGTWALASGTLLIVEAFRGPGQHDSFLESQRPPVPTHESAAVNRYAPAVISDWRLEGGSVRASPR